MFLRCHLFAILFFSLPGLVQAGQLDAISSKDVTGGLKQALEQGASAAVASLGVVDGFQGDPRFRIPLPSTIAKMAPTLRVLGRGKAVDELQLAMNRAAESAVAEAKPLLLDAVSKMTVKDARGILAGGDDSVTQYFRSKTFDALTKKFLPVVSRTTNKLRLAEQYNLIASQGATFGLVRDEDAKVEGYVTRHALNALYTRIAEEERAIRHNPTGALGALARKVFGAI